MPNSGQFSGQDAGRLSVDPAAAGEVLDNAAGQLARRLDALAAAPPRIDAARYGPGLADRAAHLVDLVNRAHRVRVSHARRLRHGVDVALGTVRSVQGTDGVSAESLGSGASRGEGSRP
ncbi:MAG TPA: hypothetical protein H9870_01575 [Candidatus Corynebacterium avicola]|uniref:Uncharacterized protein n=1 Tax=Candidatus Corynebacterium avicola TaxID=2838527 RepID=A0A9D1RLL7_9CORY|nr:hypothetical protein [Candidatus Corynebacterium avicola]